MSSSELLPIIISAIICIYIFLSETLFARFLRGIMNFGIIIFFITNLLLESMDTLKNIIYVIAYFLIINVPIAVRRYHSKKRRQEEMQDMMNAAFYHNIDNQ